MLETMAGKACRVAGVALGLCSSKQAGTEMDGQMDQWKEANRQVESDKQR
jgi:hypothetical protein